MRRVGPWAPRVLVGAEGPRRSGKGGGSGAGEAQPDRSRSLRPGSRSFAARAPAPRNSTSLGGSEEPAKRQADALALGAGLTRDAVDVVTLAGATHDQERAVPQILVVTLATRLLPRPDHEAPGDAERDDGHDRITAELRLVVGMEAHAV